jgi:hypothetical protein
MGRLLRGIERRKCRSAGTMKSRPVTPNRKPDEIDQAKEEIASALSNFQQQEVGDDKALAFLRTALRQLTIAFKADLETAFPLPDVNDSDAFQLTVERVCDLLRDNFGQGMRAPLGTVFNELEAAFAALRRGVVRPSVKKGSAIGGAASLADLEAQAIVVAAADHLYESSGGKKTQFYEHKLAGLGLPLSTYYKYRNNIKETNRTQRTLWFPNDDEAKRWLAEALDALANRDKFKKYTPTQPTIKR